MVGLDKFLDLVEFRADGFDDQEPLALIFNLALPMKYRINSRDIDTGRHSAPDKAFREPPGFLVAAASYKNDDQIFGCCTHVSSAMGGMLSPTFGRSKHVAGPIR